MFYFGDFPLMGSIVSVSSSIGWSLFMVFLVYVPVYIAFGCFFDLSGNHAFDSLLNTVLREIAMVTGGDVGIDTFLKQMNQTNHASNGKLTKNYFFKYPCILPRAGDVADLNM